MAEARVRAELFEGKTLLRLVLDAPPGNILTGALMEELAGALASHAQDPALHMVVLQGAGGNFSFGASVEEHRKAAAPGMLRSFSRLVRAVGAYPVPVAALVEGRCLGGAFELVLACHLAFTTPDAVLGCPEIKLGVFPPVLAALGPWRLGGALSDRLVLTGELLSAEGARACGLSSATFEGPDPFARFCEWYRKGPARLSAASLRIAAQAVRAGTAQLFGARLDELEQLYLERVLPSHDGNEGIEAFIARRPPVWENR
ncbi:MAG TPA: enoyl-CoA hydratase/isomerase family protein [Myxococcales bacterium]